MVRMGMTPMELGAAAADSEGLPWQVLPVWGNWSHETRLPQGKGQEVGLGKKCLMPAPKVKHMCIFLRVVCRLMFVDVPLRLSIALSMQVGVPGCNLPVLWIFAC